MADLVKVDERRVVARLVELARLGALPDGGCYRPLYSPAWLAATQLVTRWMKEAGLLVRRDAVGNVWGRVEGKQAGRVVATGSHLDTVRSGGALDGALGVVAAIEAVTSLNAVHGRPQRILEAVAICEEEGSRFSTNFWGARAITGKIEPEEAADVRDPEGMTVADAMRGVGLDPDAIPKAARLDIDAFVELHIEQGPVLEGAGARLGVVRTIAGTAHLAVAVRGRPDHAGTMAMADRHDALVGAAAMIGRIAEVASEAGHPAVATVGAVSVEPGQVNVVPGVATFTVDARHSDPERRTALVEAIVAACKRIAHERGLEIEVRTLRDRPPLGLDGALAKTLVRACEAAGVTPRDMVSGAGHDSQVLASVCRTGMLFVPSVGGRSHCPEEATEADDVILGTRVLATAIRELAY
ncbi:MAG TPA: Zn-dependent hydrolase [Candidatus Limnocylindrales bacterium]|nr:Zn-dependent hydrolase [Candidatus Limnocylindrales bacterium]